jgi:four helix bundle protein
MHNFKELKVWQKSRSLVKDVYMLTRIFPDEEKFVLTSQIRRSAISVPSNIAEGAGRGTDKDFAKFLSIALGSAYELEAQIILSLDLGYISEDAFNVCSAKIMEVQKMLHQLNKKFSKE